MAQKSSLILSATTVAILVTVTKGDNQMTYHTPQVLSRDQLQKLAPSIFATEPYYGMSDRYSFIPTIEVIDHLMGKGWLPVKALEAKSRSEERFGYTKHMVRLRKSDAAVMVGDVFPEIVLINAHDGGAAYQMMAGLYRLVCSNGMVADDSIFQRTSIRHSGNVIGEVLYTAKHIGKELPKLQGAVKQMQTIELTRDLQGAYAAAALDLKYERDEDGNSLAPISPEQLLIPRRRVDGGNDLWTTFNIVQEHLLKGGLRGRSQGETMRRVRTRAVQSVSEDVRLNRALWTLTREMAKHINRR